jgi:hypothetical protein
MFPFYIEAGQSKAVEFHFEPDLVGLKTAEIVIYSQADTLVKNISGIGVEPQLEILSDLIDFGKVIVYSDKDTLQAVTIKNISSFPLNITETKHNKPNDKDFTTLAGGGAFTLQAGETCKMDLRFAPSDAGRTSGMLEFYYDGVGSPAKIQLFGEGIYDGLDSLRLHAANVSAYDDRIIHIPIILDSMEKVKLSGVTAVSADLQYNSTLLYPNYKYERTAISPTVGQITLSDLPIDQAEGDTLIRVMFKTGLGNAEGCDLVLLNPVLTGGGTPEVITEDGYFSLLGVCHEGGARLFSESKIASGIHAIRPNPASNYVSIDIGIIEKGYTEVAIYDVLGKKIKTVFAEEVAELGERTISADLSEIANGQYMLLFKSPTYVEQKAVMIWK